MQRNVTPHYEPMTAAMPPKRSRSFLLFYLRRQPVAVGAMTVLLVVTIGLKIVVPVIAARFIESIQLGATESMLISLAFAFLGVAALYEVAKVAAAYLSERVSWTATNALREDLAEHVLRLDLTFHESRSPGELIERIDGDVNELAEFFSSLIVQLIGNVLLVVGVLAILASIDWRIGLSFALVVVVGYLISDRLSKIATTRWEADREQSAQVFGYMSECLYATEDIRSSRAAGHVLLRFQQLLRAWLPVKLRAEAWGSAVWIVLSLVFTASISLAFGFGGILYQNGTIALASVYLIFAYAMMLNEPLDVVRDEIQGLQQAAAALRRIGELFSRSSALPDGDHDLADGPLSVEFDAVDFRYAGEGPRNGDVAETLVLDNVSFRVPAGTKLGLVGRTGAGKTTIAHLLSRMYDPVGGRVLLGHLDLRTARIRSLRSRVGFVTQDVHVFDATLRDNLTFFDSSVTDQRLDALIEALELQPWLRTLPEGLDTEISARSLSAGQAQLIGLARVFLKVIL
jgi:ATP-binding cassette subfamily B protein